MKQRTLVLEKSRPGKHSPTEESAIAKELCLGQRRNQATLPTLGTTLLPVRPNCFPIRTMHLATVG